jgi:hypothetical protein
MFPTTQLSGINPVSKIKLNIFQKQPNISIENFLQFKKKLNGAPSNFDEIDIPSLNDDMMNGQNYNLNLYIQRDQYSFGLFVRKFLNCFVILFLYSF